MKIAIDKKRPFTSVDLIPEGEEDEYLTAEQTAAYKKAALRCIRLIFLGAFFSVFAILCEFFDLYDLLAAPSAEKVFAIIGYVGFGCLALSLVFVFAAGRKLQKLAKEFKDENAKNK